MGSSDLGNTKDSVVQPSLASYQPLSAPPEISVSETFCDITPLVLSPEDSDHPTDRIEVKPGHISHRFPALSPFAAQPTEIYPPPEGHFQQFSATFCPQDGSFDSLPEHLFGSDSTKGFIIPMA